MDRDRIQTWRAEGLSDAEIGRRLGVSAALLRAELREPPDPTPDDNRVDWDDEPTPGG